MSFIVKDGGDFKPHPQGQYRAVCMDVVDLGMVENKKWSKTQHKAALVFHTEAVMDDGKPWEIWERFTVTLSDQGHLRPFLESWRGKAFTPEELKGFDLEKLIGVNALIQVVHSAKDSKTYANIRGIMLLPRGVEKMAPTVGYERRRDRKQEPATVTASNGPNYDEPPASLQDDDDDLPF